MVVVALNTESWQLPELASAVHLPPVVVRRKMLLWIGQVRLIPSMAWCFLEFQSRWSVLQGVVRENTVDGVVTYFGADAAVHDDADGTTSRKGSEAGAGAAGGAGGDSVMLQDDEGDEGEARSEDFQVYESFIVGMLRNFGSLPLDRIHNMLKMFVSDRTCA